MTRSRVCFVKCKAGSKTGREGVPADGQVQKVRLAVRVRNGRLVDRSRDGKGDAWQPRAGGILVDCVDAPGVLLAKRRCRQEERREHDERARRDAPQRHGRHRRRYALNPMLRDGGDSVSRTETMLS